MSWRNFSLLVFSVLFFFNSLALVNGQQILITVHPTPTTNVPYTNFLTQNLTQYNRTFPQGVIGSPQLIVTTNYGIQLCISEFAPFDDVSSCPPGGYFQVSPQNSTSSVLSDLETDGDVTLEEFYAESKRFSYDFLGFQENATSQQFDLNNLRGGSPYFLSVALYPLNQTLTNGSVDITVTLSFSSDLCPGINCVYFPSALQCYPTAPLENGKVDVNLQPGGSDQFVFFDSYLGSQALLVSSTVTAIPSEDNENFYNTLQDTNTTVYFSIYVKRGALPTPTTYDQLFNVPINALDNVQFNILGPIPGRYYFLFQNTIQSLLSVSMSVNSSVCSNQMVGPACDESYVDLTNSINATQFNGTGKYQYFLINKTEVLVGVGLYYANSTAPTISASYLNLPTNESFILTSAGNNVNFIWSSISVYVVQPHFNYWWISVWANGNESYYIWANTNCPNNCSANSTVPTGNCSISTGVCSCETGYTGLWCFPPETKHKLKAVWIVLIVIACVIILAIAIGVPVACYLKSRRRARYERV